MSWLQVVTFIISILSFLGVGTVFATMWKEWMSKKAIQKQSMESIKLGIQAMLRAQMIDMYNEAKAKGYAHIYEKENFENCYKQYHNLGANGVITQLHDEYLEMPTDKEN